MKVSIRTRVSLVLIGFAGVILMLAFAAALYGMAWGRDFAAEVKTAAGMLELFEK